MFLSPMTRVIADGAVCLSDVQLSIFGGVDACATLPLRTILHGIWTAIAAACTDDVEHGRIPVACPFKHLGAKLFN
jgi:hypothetical protein